MRLNKTIGLLGIGLLGAYVSYQVFLRDQVGAEVTPNISQLQLDPDTASQLPIDQNTAVERAIAYARDRGLQQNRPERLAVKLMTLHDYLILTGSKPKDAPLYPSPSPIPINPSPEPGFEDVENKPTLTQLGLDPSQRVWVVTMRGPVMWTGFGKVAGKCPECGEESDKFDNITIVLSAETGRYISRRSVEPGYPLPLPLP